MKDIKDGPWYEKYLKKLFDTKNKLKDNKEIGMKEYVSSMLQRRLPSKCNDVNNELLAQKFDITYFKIFNNGGWWKW